MDSRDLAGILLVRLPVLNITVSQDTYESLRQRIVMNDYMGEPAKEEGRRYISGKLMKTVIWSKERVCVDPHALSSLKAKSCQNCHTAAKQNHL